LTKNDLNWNYKDAVDGVIKLSEKCFLSGFVLFVLAVFPLIVLVNAEPSWIMWSQFYGGTDQDGWLGNVHLVETSDGGFAVFGDTHSFGAGNVDFWLVKTNALGDMEWNRTYGGTDFEHAYSLVGTSDGGFALFGDTSSFGVGGSDFWLVKTDSSGNMEWNRTYGGTEHEQGSSLVLTSDGGYALAGHIQPTNGGDADFWLVKTDANGNMEWNHTYGGANTEVFPALIKTSDGGFALAGNRAPIDSGRSDFWLIKTDGSGNLEWNQTYGGAGHDYVYSLVQTLDGGFALAGDTHSFSVGDDTDFWLIKTDASGNIEWDRTFGESGVDIAHSLTLASDGGFALVGETDSFSGGNRDFWLVKTDETGFIEWSRTYGGIHEDKGNSLVQTSDGGYAMAGNTFSFGAGGSDFWLVKTNELGIPEFPSWIILPLILTIPLFSIIVKRKLHNVKAS
jgi:hypothetical protein